MEITQNTIMNWEDVKKYYPNEWVVLGNPIFEGMNVLEGIVLAHHTDKRVASIEGGERRADFNKFTLIFTGQMPSRRRIGLLRRITKPQ